ncbi:MAG: hypothetical protein WA190_00080 [Usitatibacter sp.]
MKIAVGGLLLVVAVLVGVVIFQLVKSDRQQLQIAALTDAIANKTAAREDFERQKECAAQSEREFRALGWEKENQAAIFPAAYQSHFNAKFNKCFMSLESHSPDGKVTSRSLFDVYQHRDYATYMWMVSPTKKYWEVPPTICTLTPIGSDEVTCKSDEEYKAFVALYME